MLIPELHDYAESRGRFLALAEQAGAAIEHYRHPLPGPDGTEVATDVARIGAAPGSARNVLIVASGTHGVEGHAGWGLQVRLFETGRLGALASGTAVVLVHAVNPYGMAWSRRVDHENVDVNRNFVDFAAPLPPNPRYADVDRLLNPVTLEDLEDSGWSQELRAYAAEVGMVEAFRAVSGGQYDHPAGVQFGGRRPTWSRRTLAEIWSRHLGGAAMAMHVDLHTGLGACGGLTVFQTADRDDAAAQAAADWFGEVFRVDRPVEDAPLQQGVLGPGFEEFVSSGVLAVPVVLEFGTFDQEEVLGVMRADNWLNQHGDPASPLGADIRRRTRDAFFVDDVEWRRDVAEAGMPKIHAALDALASLS